MDGMGNPMCQDSTLEILAQTLFHVARQPVIEVIVRQREEGLQMFLYVPVQDGLSQEVDRLIAVVVELGAQLAQHDGFADTGFPGEQSHAGAVQQPPKALGEPSMRPIVSQFGVRLAQTPILSHLLRCVTNRLRGFRPQVNFHFLYGLSMTDY